MLKRYKVPLVSFYELWEDYTFPSDDPLNNPCSEMIELMKKANAVVGDDDEEDVDLNRFDSFIFKHLEQLEETAKSTGNPKDISTYCYTSWDLLDDRLAILGLIMDDVSSVASSKREKTVAKNRIKSAQNDLLVTVDRIEKLIAYFIRAHAIAVNHTPKHSRSPKTSSKPKK